MPITTVNVSRRVPASFVSTRTSLEALLPTETKSQTVGSHSCVCTVLLASPLRIGVCVGHSRLVAAPAAACHCPLAPERATRYPDSYRVHGPLSRRLGALSTDGLMTHAVRRCMGHVI